ncbi:hypothetical protein V6N13_065689 [Hibiscus sabdariffa]
MNAVQVRNQKHELTPPRNSDKGDSLLPRDIAYKQASRGIGLRDKSVTQQDALPNSKDPLRYLPRQEPLSLPRHPLCHPAEADYQSRCIDEVETLTVESDTIAI